MATKRRGELRSTGAALEVTPLVTPEGQFVYSPIASNLSDGLTHKDGQLTADAASRGYQTIAQVADNEAQAKELEAGLKLAFGQRKGAPVPERLMPKKVVELRKRKKKEAGAVAFGQNPKAKAETREA